MTERKMTRHGLFASICTRSRGTALWIVCALLLPALILAAPAQAAPQPSPVAPNLVPRSYIYISGDDGFTAQNGVSAGNGSASNPFVIAGFDINVTGAGWQPWDTGIYIEHTTAWFVIRDVYIHADWQRGENGAIVLDSTANGRVENVTFDASRLAIASSSNTTVSHVSFPHGGVLRVASSLDVSVAWSSLRSGVATSGPIPTRIDLYNATRPAVTDNDIQSVDPCQICLSVTTSAVLSRNRMAFDGIAILGSRREHFNSHTITPDNLVNNAPVLYVKDGKGTSIVGGAVGQAIVANTTDAYLWGIDFNATSIPVQVAFSRNVLVGASRADATSTHRQVAYYGMRDYANAVSVSYSADVLVALNRMRTTDVALRFLHSRNITVYGNNLTALHATALVFDDSENATASYNSVMGTWKPVWIRWSRNITVYRNSFFEFEAAPNVISSTNASFDRGYHGGGNYWFNYRGMDNCAGPTQWDCEHSDGIGDVWYVINATIEDRYPLMSPPSLPPAAGSMQDGDSGFPYWVLLTTMLLIAVVSALLLRRRRP